MAEVLIIIACTRESLLSLIVGTIPLHGEVYILRDVTSQREHSIVAEVARDIRLVINLRGCTRPVHARHNIKVTLYGRNGEAIANMRTNGCIAIHILVGRVLQGVVLLAIDGDCRGIIRDTLTHVVLRELCREHPHKGAALLNIRAHVVEVKAMVVRRPEVRVTLRDILGIRHIVNILKITHIGVV